MAFKLFSRLREIPILNRNVFVQQRASLKQSLKDKLQDLNLPDKPKKPLTPYFRFLKEYRIDYMKKNPESKVTVIVKQGAVDWAKANSTLKEKYTDEYKLEMQDYTKKILEYAAKLTPEQKDSIKEVNKEKLASKKKRDMKKKLRDNDKPKRPLGPYMQFLIEKSKQTNKKMVDLMHELKGHWQTMTDPEKHRYIQLYEDDKKRYELQMTDWERRMIAEGNSDIVRQSALQAHKPSRLAKVEKPKKQ